MVAGVARAAAILVFATPAFLMSGGVGAQDLVQIAPPAASPSSPSSSPPSPPNVPLSAPPRNDQSPANSVAPPLTPPADEPAAAPAADTEKPRPRPSTPVGPPAPLRAPAAILRVLDKVTAETMAFNAPVGRRVRYKTLVFEVKACETRDAGDALPQPSAYLVITSDAGMSAGAILGPRQIFKGWMFANAPSLHVLKHPVYDAWLVSCNAASPLT